MANVSLVVNAVTALATSTTNAPYMLLRNNKLNIIVMHPNAVTTLYVGASDLYIAANDVLPGQVLNVVNSSNTNAVFLKTMYTGSSFYPVTASNATIMPGTTFSGMYYINPSTGNLTIAPR